MRYAFPLIFGVRAMAKMPGKPDGVRMAEQAKAAAASRGLFPGTPEEEYKKAAMPMFRRADIPANNCEKYVETWPKWADEYGNRPPGHDVLDVWRDKRGRFTKPPKGHENRRPKKHV